MKSAVFFDRDGVLNEAIVRDNKAYGPLTMDQFHLVHDVTGQIRRLKKAGFICIVFTNQPDLARGLLCSDHLEKMHHKLKSEVELDDLFVCPHDNDDGCLCRKPKPGMLFEAVKKWQIRLESSFVVGDRWRDIDAGRAAGCQTILIEYPYSNCKTADFVVSNLIEAVDIILTQQI